MSEPQANQPRTHLRSYLAGGYAVFIVYASLSPFYGWQEQGVRFAEILLSPLAQTFTWFDFGVNLLAYIPFGFLLTMMLRSYFSVRHGMWLAVLLGVGMSVLMEYAQLFLPSRVSSNTDLLSNALGVVAGAVLALNIESRRWFMVMQQAYGRWFRRGSASDFGLALLALWMFAQINPSLPMLGSVFISQMTPMPFEAVPVQPFSWLDSTAVMLNLLMPGVLLLTLLREPRHGVSLLLLALALVIMAKFLVAAVLLKSWALLLWLNSEAMLGVLAGVLLVGGARHLPGRLLLISAALAVLAYMALLYWGMDSSAPAGTLRLYHWHYGHMLHYNALSHAVALLFPLMLLGYLGWVWQRSR